MVSALTVVAGGRIKPIKEKGRMSRLTLPEQPLTPIKGAGQSPPVVILPQANVQRILSRGKQLWKYASGVWCSLPGIKMATALSHKLLSASG